MNFIVKILLSSFSIMVASWLLNGVIIQDYFTAVLVSFVLALLNMIVKPILVIFTIPITIFTFGLFLLVINAVIALIADRITPGFALDSFWTALWFSLIVSVINYFINLDDRKKERNYR